MLKAAFYLGNERGLDLLQVPGHKQLIKLLEVLLLGVLVLGVELVTEVDAHIDVIERTVVVWLLSWLLSLALFAVLVLDIEGSP